MNGQVTSASQRELVALAQRGDENAFEALFHTYRRRVYCLCLRMTRDPNQAEDLTQDAFLQLFRRISTFRGESAFSTWLHRLVVNVVLMRLRKKEPPQISLDDANSNGTQQPVKREYGADDPRLAQAIDRISIAQALSALPPGYLTTVLFHDLHGYQHYEIAEFRDCSVGNSKSQLHKARRKLRALLTAKRRPGLISAQRRTSLMAARAARQPAFITALAMLNGG